MCGLTKDILDALSFKSRLPISLNHKLRDFDREALFNEVMKIPAWYDKQEILPELGLDYRIKSQESIKSKCIRYWDSKTAKMLSTTF